MVKSYRGNARQSRAAEPGPPTAEQSSACGTARLGRASRSAPPSAEQSASESAADSVGASSGSEFRERERFGELYRRHFSDVYRYVRSRTGVEEAEDVTQDVFVNVLRSMKTFRETGTVAAWVFGVARRTVAALYRRRTLSTSSLDAIPNDHPDLPRSTDHPESVLLYQERLRRMQRVCDGLELDQWLIFRRRHLEGQGIPEIAGELGRTEHAIRSKLYRVRKAIELA